MRRLPGLAVAAVLLTIAAVAGRPTVAAPAPAPAPAKALPAKTAPAAGLPTEIPATVTVSHEGFDFERREAEIPMRDGVTLHTVILVPHGARATPMLLTRTPYDADDMSGKNPSTHLAMAIDGYDSIPDLVADGAYIRVLQDVRGKYGSDGDYVMNRPLHGPLNPTAVDHSTDTYDTIDWLVKHVPESNGKVGILGVSYDGFTSLMGLVDPHPALKVAVPMNPMVDGWRGDDWFHNGAFRQLGMSYIYEQEATRKNEELWPLAYHDDYDLFMDAGSAGELGRRRGLDQVGFWQKILAHPAYDSFWSDQAVDRVLAARPLTVPVMLVHSLWDQEDLYGALAVYRALAPKDPSHDKLFLVMGPWVHGGELGDGSELGPLELDSATGKTFRRDILRPFLDQYLRDGAPKANVAPVTAFESGTNVWRRLDTWPSACAKGCSIAPTPLYLGAGGAAGFTAPARPGWDEYVSDPARPVTHMPRPVVELNGGDEWRYWLVSDQRQAAARPDVLVYQTAPLTAPLKISGTPQVNLVASTTGTDADWVVKLIDVYPPEVPGDHDLGGYQLAVSMDIFRGRYREGLDRPKPIAAGKPLPYTFALPDANHVFLPGHRIMVQVQSSWFPLYDRNPQTFVPNIFLARPGDYRKATMRVYRSPGQASSITLPVARGP
ncbi:MAG TPA: CocE/NonD family hydrolase [Kofleriaceae bacterium]|nr:CocE/NonD family hydrolase [Kofleriaceae bacterium]